MQNSDIDNNKALVHLKLADQQLAIVTSSENNMISPNAALESSKVLMATTPIPSTVSSSTLNHNPLPSSPVYIHKTTDINKNKIIVTTPQDSTKSKSKDPSLPYYDPDFPDKPANMPFCSQPKANANHKVCYDESDNPHPPCTKYPDDPACATGKNVAGQGQPVKSCNISQDSACIMSITSTLQPENLNPSAIGGGQLSPQIQNNPPSPQQSSDELLDKASAAQLQLMQHQQVQED